MTEHKKRGICSKNIRRKIKQKVVEIKVTASAIAKGERVGEFENKKVIRNVNMVLKPLLQDLFFSFVGVDDSSVPVSFIFFFALSLLFTLSHINYNDPVFYQSVIVHNRWQRRSLIKVKRKNENQKSPKQIEKFIACSKKSGSGKNRINEMKERKASGQTKSN